MKRWRGLVFGAIIVLSCVSAEGVLAADDDEGAAILKTIVLQGGGQETGEEGACEYSCLVCDPGWHTILWDSIPDSTSDEGKHGCRPFGGCWAETHDCELWADVRNSDGVEKRTLLQAQPDEFWQAFADASPETLSVFLSNNPDVAYVNAKRQSIQLFGCNGSVVANIRLTERQFAGLTP